MSIGMIGAPPLGPPPPLVCSEVRVSARNVSSMSTPWGVHVYIRYYLRCNVSVVVLVRLEPLAVAVVY